MLKILKHFGIFLVVFAGLFWLNTRPVLLQKGAETYRAVMTPVMQTAFGKTNMYSEPVKMQNKKEGVFRLVMTNDAELQKQIALAKQQGLKKIDAEGKEFFVDYQLFFLMSWLFFTALLIATPMQLKAKLWSLFLGSIIFLLYTVGRLYIMMLDFLSNQVDIGIYQYGEFWSGILKSVGATQKLGFSILVAFVLWLIFTLKYTDLAAVFSGISEQKDTILKIPNRPAAPKPKKKVKKRKTRA